MLFTFIFVMNIHSKHPIYDRFFTNDPETITHIEQMMPIFILVIIVVGLQKILQGIMKTLQVQNFWKIIVFCLYLIGLSSSLIFGFYFDMRLNGIWGGWLLGLVVLTVYEIVYLFRVSWEDDFDKVRLKYIVIQENIRQSRI